MAKERLWSDTSSIADLFGGKIFRVPDYQRTFSWERQNWEDFWNDIKEALDTDTPHYWGTITLRDTDLVEEHGLQEYEVFDVVDGQQRVTTFYLFLLALSQLGHFELEDDFIKSGDIYRLQLGSLNKTFLTELVEGKEPEAKFRTNERIEGAFDYLKHQIGSYRDSGNDLGSLARYFLNSTLSLEFQVSDENMAIRAFQSLNDRGKDLTLLDKTKSFLMFYSSRYLDSGLSDLINEGFGDIFMNYDFIEEGGRELGIAYIANPRYRFSEDELLRFFYHYFARYAIRRYGLRGVVYDYTIPTEGVFKRFLKKSCNRLKDDQDRLSQFIADFLSDFVDFVTSFRELVDKAREKSPHQRLFRFLGPNANIYPLIIGLETEDMLDGRLLAAIETLDVRVYKVRGTNPRAKLYKATTSRIKEIDDPNRILAGILEFTRDFMRDSTFESYLYRDMYRNPATKYILWEFENHGTESFDAWDLDLYGDLQTEHMFPREPTFDDWPTYGFEESEYVDHVDRLGNLTLLEGRINERIGNRVPEAKAPEYQDSQVPGTRKLGFRIDNDEFRKNDIEERTEQIIDFCVERWNLS